MAEAQLTKTFEFSASHRYFRPEWSEQENLRVFGKCAYPHGHGHNYQMYVTVKGQIDPDTGMAAVQTPAASNTGGQLDPVVDYITLAWTDGRAVSSTMIDTTSDFDVYGAVFGAAPAFPGEQLLMSGAAAQVVKDADGTLFTVNDYSAGNADVAVVGFSGSPLALSTHPGTQADPTISGDVILWEDNRRGKFDIYGTIPRPYLLKIDRWVQEEGLLATVTFIPGRNRYPFSLECLSKRTSW